MLHFILAKTREDAALLHELAVIIWTEHYTSIIGEAQVQYMLKNFQSANNIYQDMSAGTNYFMIQKDDEWVGYLAYSLKNDHLFLSKLYVKNNFRHQGIAKTAFQKILAIAEEKQLSEIQLTCNKYNQQSIVAYEKLGFKKITETKVDIGEGYIMDDYVMAYPTNFML